MTRAFVTAAADHAEELGLELREPPVEHRLARLEQVRDRERKKICARREPWLLPAVNAFPEDVKIIWL